MELNQLLLHAHEKLVVSDDLQSQHSVHRLVVIGGILLLDFVDIKGRRGLLLDLSSNGSDLLFTRLTTTSRLSWLNGEDVLKDDSGRALISCNLSVLVESEGLSSWGERK